MSKIQKYILWLGTLSVFILLIQIIFNYNYILKPLVIISAISIAIGQRVVPSLKKYQYTTWIIVAIICGMMYPTAFLQWGNFDLRSKWVILIIVQLVMFGMGTQMSFKNFTNLKSMSRGILVGILCQFLIMPLTAYALIHLFHFEPEIAAGVILIGSCSSGLASNVMVYIARANLTLSIALTSIATLLAPIMTPFWMKTLAGSYIKIDFLDMCIQIIKIVIVPIGAAMLIEVFRSKNKTWIRRLNRLFFISILSLLVQAAGLWKYLDNNLSDGILKTIEILNFFSGALIVGKTYYFITLATPRISELMPKVSMFGIVYFTLVTTAASHASILAIGLVMLFVSVMHNSLGYFFGYWISRGLGLSKDSCRTIALEVGLQNGGMASGLAGVMGKLATMGMAAAIFSPWMNISGSVLANFWRKKNK